MRKVRGNNTKPERIVQHMLWNIGRTYLIHARNLPGKPDIVLPSIKKVVFIHGCFWHAHRCRYGKPPKSHRAFWNAKRAANRARDKRNNRKLRKMGWTTLTVWECQLRRKPKAVVSKLTHFTRKRSTG